MGARRLRFTPVERDAFVAGAEIEFLNATRWRPGVVVSGVIEVDSVGYQYVAIRVPGVAMAVRGYAKGLRLVDRVGAYV